ncbi:MAG: hypothetical protein KIT69_17065, partial [Propionibacteriaceae bacterium]|nr:hypothetical protein [Propionibacteriaceae bacterium]
MSGYLLDTSILSERRRRQANPAVAAWLDAAPQDRLKLSVLSLAEIRYGVELLAARDPRAAEPIERWLAELTDRFAERLLPVDCQ